MGTFDKETNYPFDKDTNYVYGSTYVPIYQNQKQQATDRNFAQNKQYNEKKNTAQIPTFQ